MEILDTEHVPSESGRKPARTLVRARAQKDEERCFWKGVLAMVHQQREQWGRGS